MIKYLFEELPSMAWSSRIPMPYLPAYITDNLKYTLFDWQKEALVNFLTKEQIKIKEEDNDPTHLLFHMATGSGKTLLLAALVLYYYNQGYRHFIFFVNQNNIVGKTEENLTNPSHPKYLFRQNIVVDDRTVQIKKVETFSSHTDDIEILFTSIHKLHNAIYTVKENSVYLEDLQKRKIVMLGDEAHHLNADTKRKGAQLDLDLPTALSEKASLADLDKSWEDTILKKLLHKGSYAPPIVANENVLLEFTATIPRDEAVKEKYAGKTIYSFGVKEFLRAGYTKEINLISSSFNKKNRILQALLFNWYRHRIALKYGIHNFKPVILFRSKLIGDSYSDFEAFKELVKQLTVKDFSFLEDIPEEQNTEGSAIYEKGKSRIIDIKHFIRDNSIDWSEIIAYLKDAFKERNCLITNSKSGTKTLEKTDAEQERLLNSLEERGNKITAIFTVQRLTEGWDVLNLFDIVRLYEGQNEGGANKKTSEATTSEVQLIGRGIRYYPFAYGDKTMLKRKFDDDLSHELRVLEEFYYHSDDEHRYLSQLKNELKSKDFLDDKRRIKRFALKDGFKESAFYTSVKLWVNKQDSNPARRKTSLEDLKTAFTYEGSLENFNEEETRLEMDKEEDTARYSTKKEDGRTIGTKLSAFQLHILRKAVNIKAKKDRSLFRFSNLKEELQVETIDDLFKEPFLGNMELTLSVPKQIEHVDDLSNYQQLSILLGFFDAIEKRLKEISNPYIGSAFTTDSFSNVFGEEKEKLVEENEDSAQLEKELVEKDWYLLNSFHGTSEERSLIEFLKYTIANLEEKYEETLLLRNEEMYTIYDFDRGRGFQPDFLLFLKQQKKKLYYQVFIEPKGDQFKDSTGGFAEGKEAWKEVFLEVISAQYGITNTLQFENNEYRLIGLPLFNEKKKEVFRKKFNEVLEII